MSTFNYSDYQNIVNRAQSAPANSSVKVGFFKLADGEEALVRINCASIDDLKFASVHVPIFGKKFEGLGSGFTPVSCLNEVGSYDITCPFCRAAAENHDTVAKATKKVYLEMVVAYKDARTQGWSEAIPVVWERPAGFSREIANKLRDYGNLRETIFKITRSGAGKDTRYTLDYIPLLNKPELVPNDFSAFNNFNVAKHSYWEKSAEDLEAYLATGSFPEVVKDTVSVQPAVAPVAPVATPVVEQPVQPVVQPAPAPVVQPAVEERPNRDFSGLDKWSF